MARSRNIKPGFFRNENLVELPYETRLLFIGLWTIADREGRLEDRPKRIKMELFPADDLNVDACLQQLHDAGFILRYAVEDARYIQVLAFSKHQNPHQKEQASIIPAPDSLPIDGGNTPDKHDASTGHAPDKHDASPALTLNTDSPLPQTSSDARKRAPVDDSHPFALLEALCDMLGQDTSILSSREKGKQLAAGKRLVADGVTPEDVSGVTRWLMSQSWRSTGVDLFTVEKHIGEWKLSGRPEKATPGALRVHAGGRADDPDINPDTGKPYAYNDARSRKVFVG